MPMFNCVQCCDCSTFQSAQARKDKKFSCKLCGKKQSVVKVFARSESGADVRKVVQRLNLARGTAAEEYEQTRAERDDDYHIEKPKEDVLSLVAPAQSRWQHLARAIDAAEGRIALHEAHNEEEEDADDQQFVTSVPDFHSAKRGRKRARKNAASGANEYSERKESAPLGKHGKQARYASSARNERLLAEDNDQEHRDICPATTQTAIMSNSIATRATAPGSTDDSGFFTSMDGDVAFEEEYM